MSAAEPFPHPRRSAYRVRIGNGKQKETVLSQQRTRGIRDGISRGKGWIAVIADIAVIARDRKSKTLLLQIALVELPDGAWRGTKCRDATPLSLTSPFGFAQGLQDLVNG